MYMVITVEDSGFAHGQGENRAGWMRGCEGGSGRDWSSGCGLKPVAWRLLTRKAEERRCDGEGC